MEAQSSIQAVIPTRANPLQKFIKRYGKWGTKLTGAIGDQAIFAASNFFINVLLARWMTPTEFGAFVVAYSWLLLPQNFYESILIEPMTVFGAGKYGKMLRAYLGYVFYGHLLLSGLVALVMIIGAIFVYVFDSPLVGSALLGAGLSAPLVLTRWLSRRPFYITSKPHWAAIGGAIYFVLSVAILLVVRQMDVIREPMSYCLPIDPYPCQTLNQAHLLTPFSAMMIMGVAGVIASAFLTFYLIRPQWRLEEQGELTLKNVVKDHWQYGTWASGSRLLIWIPSNVYYLVLPLFMSLAESGALRALTNLIQPIYMSMSAITAILMPTFVRTFRSRGKPGVNSRMTKIIYLSLVFTGGYFIVITFFGGWIMSFLYDGKFDDIVTFPVLVTMAAVPLFTGIRTIMDAALRAMGGVKHSFISKIIPTVFTLTIGIAMLATLGVLGVNLSNLITSVISLLTLWYFYRNTNPEPPKKAEVENSVDVEAIVPEADLV